MSMINLEELSAHDGKSGNAAYVAVNGKVYDISDSKMWKNGVHMGQHHAGIDLTAALGRAPHGVEVLEGFETVGELEADNVLQTVAAIVPDIEDAEDASSFVDSAPVIPWWARFLIFMKSHPITVHFPQALFVLAPIFLTLFYFVGLSDFERTAFFLMTAALLFSIPATITGFVHWWFKYEGSSRVVFKFKIFLSPLLIILAAVTAGVHFGRGILPVDEPDWSMLVLYWIQFPIAMLLGKAGGGIVFGGKQK